jgi:hypothetical protein
MESGGSAAFGMFETPDARTAEIALMMTAWASDVWG